MENKCENCIHYDLCVELMAHTKHQEKDFVKECLSKVNGCTDHFKDKSLCVELPCKVGDTVYISDFAEVMEAFASNIKMFYNYLTKEIENVVDLRIIGNFSIHKNFKDFGKTVFLTEEEAERKLKEMENGK